jgi:uncharacterized MnhB-related membrane protein
VTTALQLLGLLLVAAGGWCVVRTRDPLNQALVTSVQGLLLGVLMILFQAPDVAFSAIVVGAVALPLMILLALAKVRGAQR